MSYYYAARLAKIIGEKKIHIEKRTCIDYHLVSKQREKYPLMDEKKTFALIENNIYHLKIALVLICSQEKR